jgi:hypothetical protein
VTILGERAGYRRANGTGAAPSRYDVAGRVGGGRYDSEFARAARIATGAPGEKAGSALGKIVHRIACIRGEIVPRDVNIVPRGENERQSGTVHFLAHLARGFASVLEIFERNREIAHEVPVANLFGQPGHGKRSCVIVPAAVERIFLIFGDEQLERWTRGITSETQKLVEFCVRF